MPYWRNSRARTPHTGHSNVEEQHQTHVLKPKTLLLEKPVFGCKFNVERISGTQHITEDGLLKLAVQVVLRIQRQNKKKRCTHEQLKTF